MGAEAAPQQGKEVERRESRAFEEVSVPTTARTGGVALSRPPEQNTLEEPIGVLSGSGLPNLSNPNAGGE